MATNPQWHGCLVSMVDHGHFSKLISHNSDVEKKNVQKRTRTLNQHRCWPQKCVQITNLGHITNAQQWSSGQPAFYSVRELLV